MRKSFQSTKKKEYVFFFRRKPFLLGVGLLLVGALYFGLPSVFRTTYEPALPASVAEVLPAPDATPKEPPVVHQKTPDAVKAIYMTSCVVGTPSFRNDLVQLVEETELNSLIIDIKDFSGYLSFRPKSEELADLVSRRCMAPDMKEFIRTLHDKGIYVIGRITVFQDPVLTLRRPDLAVKKQSDGSTWKDYKGLSFTDAGSKEVWDYIIDISKESYAIGFDELNFDYVRFPSDGPMSDIKFTWSGNRKKAEVIEDFFIYLAKELKPTGAVLSADLFGMTTTNTDDLNIGQIMEKAAPSFDYIAPMIYPSHYPKYFNGWANPNEHIYGVIKYSMDRAVERFRATTTTVKLRGVKPLASTTPPLYPKKAWHPEKLRPWLQDFDYGGNYDIAEVRAQIQAVYDSGLTSWMLWAPSNRYTKGALLPAE